MCIITLNNSVHLRRGLGLSASSASPLNVSQFGIEPDSMRSSRSFCADIFVFLGRCLESICLSYFRSSPMFLPPFQLGSRSDPSFCPMSQDDLRNFEVRAISRQFWCKSRFTGSGRQTLNLTRNVQISATKI
jgi:hypothetical protein